ncbi:DUF5313 family protein [Williamsia herbipolensis]|uniref:DUF5313 family protein n=1 Tax=Williamsia herbipolensis TaxID=1603258 RepID=UPI000824E1DD|nr:DUF5313 family protein [Williamsia herbipolensis]
MSAQPVRPSLVKWLGYVVGRTLPVEYNDWVRNDLTGRHAAARHILRNELVFSPFFIAALFLPGPWILRLSTLALGLILGTFYTVAYMKPQREGRLLAHGLPADLLTAHEAIRHDQERLSFEHEYRSGGVDLSGSRLPPTPRSPEPRYL